MANALGQYECSRCNKFKDPEEYYRHPNSASGLQSRCKECMKEDARKYGTAAQERGRVIANALAYKSLKVRLAYYDAGRTPPEEEHNYDDTPNASRRDMLLSLGYDVSTMTMYDARSIADQIHREADEYKLLETVRRPVEDDWAEADALQALVNKDRA